MKITQKQIKKDSVDGVGVGDDEFDQFGFTGDMLFHWHLHRLSFLLLCLSN